MWSNRQGDCLDNIQDIPSQGQRLQISLLLTTKHCFLGGEHQGKNQIYARATTVFTCLLECSAVNLSCGRMIWKNNDGMNKSLFVHASLYVCVGKGENTRVTYVPWHIKSTCRRNNTNIYFEVKGQMLCHCILQLWLEAQLYPRRFRDTIIVYFYTCTMCLHTLLHADACQLVSTTIVL